MTSDSHRTDTPSSLLGTLHELAIEIVTLELFTLGSDPRAVPLDVFFDDIITSHQHDTLNTLDDTIHALTVHDDVLTAEQSAFCVYRVTELSAQTMLQQHQHANRAVAYWLDDGCDITTALHQVTETASTQASSIDAQFTEDAVTHGLKPFQAAFALNFIRQQQPLPQPASLP